ncbi:hypothetical protein FO519_006335 [Halicephalobus sp. NKZ332]|nr:hypothetical protein FO519_006335 [Halicephalobus sp. NKZ332]
MRPSFWTAVLIETGALICCAGILNGLLTFGYYTLLFKISLAPLIAGFSFIFFGLTTVGHALAVATGVVVLSETGLMKIYDSSSGCKKNCLTILSAIIVIFILIFQFFVSIYGLVVSIEIFSSKNATCPIDERYSCHSIVVCFFLTILFSLLRREFFQTRHYKDIEVNTHYDGLTGIYHKTTVIVEDGVKTEINELTRNGITKKTTTVTDAEGKVKTTVEIFGPDGKPVKHENKRRVDGRILLKTFLMDPRASVKKTMKQMRQRKEDLEAGKSTEMKPLSE